MVKTFDKEGVEAKPMKDTFWLDGYEGKCSSGFYVRSDLFKKIAEFKELGCKVVGIKIEPDSWNLEFFCKKSEEVEENEM